MKVVNAVAMVSVESEVTTVAGSPRNAVVLQRGKSPKLEWWVTADRLEVGGSLFAEGVVE